MPVAIAISVYTAGASSALLGASSTFSSAAAATSSLGGISSFFAGVASAFQTQALITTAIGGALSGAVATGTLKGAVKGGIFAAVTFGIGHGAAGGASPFGDKGRFFAHAAAAGISAEIDGGKFGHGFVASYISIGADKIGLANFKHTSSRIVANAIVAGTISEVTGGKFANGAMSAAFRVAFNDTFNKYPSKYPSGRFKTKGAAIVAAHDNNQSFRRGARAPIWGGNSEVFGDTSGSYVYYNEDQGYYEVSNVIPIDRNGSTWIRPDAGLFEATRSNEVPNINSWFGDDKTVVALVVTQESLYGQQNVYDKAYQSYANKIGTVVVSTENGYHHTNYKFGVTSKTYTDTYSATKRYEE
jgi:hypothetical protein